MNLFPNKFKKPGAWVFYPTALVGLIYLFVFDGELPGGVSLEVWIPALLHDDFLVKESGIFIKNNIGDEILTILIIVSGFLTGFSQEKVEDEYIAKMRSDSLVWSLFINYSMVLLATLSVFGFYFLNVMMVQMFAILLVFNLRFSYKLRKHYRSVLSNEE